MNEALKFVADNIIGKYIKKHTCRDCNGRKKIAGVICPKCNGMGVMLK